MNILDRINKPNDIKDIDREDLPEDRKSVV